MLSKVWVWIRKMCCYRANLMPTLGFCGVGFSCVEVVGYGLEVFWRSFGGGLVLVYVVFGTGLCGVWIADVLN